MHVVVFAWLACYFRNVCNESIPMISIGTWLHASSAPFVRNDKRQCLLANEHTNLAQRLKHVHWDKAALIHVRRVYARIVLCRSLG